MAGKVFLTGYPGFIAKQLIQRLALKDPDAHYVFLIQKHLRKTAEEGLAWLDERVAGLAARCSLEEGDISKSRLGMSEEAYEQCAKDVSQVWHLAAIYDLAVPASIAYRVNVIGTANVLDFCEACERFERLDYISTCYVSGDRHGLVLEDELDEGQTFKNHYESTKCWAEMEVRRRMDRIKTVIYRPGIVVGDSRTGETDKYDGPYFLMLLLMRLSNKLPMVNIGRGDARVNLVPVDFLTDAMASIGTNPDAIGKAVQLADPNPRSSREIVEGLLDLLDYRKALATVPPPLVSGALRVGLLRRMVKIPKESVIYFNHEVQYDTMNQRKLLKETGLACPDLLSYLPTLVDYVRAHPEKQFLDERTF